MSRTEVEPNVSLEEQKGKAPVILCPGFHPAQLTEQFVRSVFSSSWQPLVVDAFCADPLAVFDWMGRSLGTPGETTQPVTAIGFSGGVVGIVGALLLWQQQGGRVQKLIAIDGWGVPIVGLPVCRLSHDPFTHWSSLPLGAGKVNFYADPPVNHLQMWGEPERVWGQTAENWQGQGQRMTAAEFIRQTLKQTLGQPDI